MSAVFVIILLASLVAFIIGIFKPSLFSKIHIHTRKSSSLFFGVLILLSFILVGITGPAASQSSQKQTLQAVITHTPPTTLKPTLIPTVTIKPQPTNIPPTIASYNTTQTAPSAIPSNTGSGVSNNNYYTNVNGNQVHSPAYSTNGQVPTGATAQCNDGTYSFSQHHSGTCSEHGGVAQWL